MKRSLLVVGIGAATLFALQLAADHYATVFAGIPWALSLIGLALVLAILGGLVYRFLRGGVVAKFTFIALMVIVANGMVEILLGSDPAYPGLALLLVVPFVIACWLGAVAAMVLAKFDAARMSGSSSPH